MFTLFQDWPFPAAVAVLFVIVMLRAGGTYALGRAANAGARRTRLAHLMARGGFQRAQRLIARWGAPVVTLSFLTVGLQTMINLAAGVTQMPLRRYLPALTIGSVLWAFLYASVGAVTWAALRSLWDRSPVGAVALGVVLVVGLAGYIAWQARHRAEEPQTHTVGV